jgi:hypothetical protein
VQACLELLVHLELKDRKDPRDHKVLLEEAVVLLAVRALVVLQVPVVYLELVV